MLSDCYRMVVLLRKPQKILASDTKAMRTSAQEPQWGFDRFARRRVDT